MSSVKKKDSGGLSILTDVHVHLQDKRFGSDLEAIFDRARQAGVGRFLCSATGPGDWFSLQKLARRYDHVLVTYGIHPWFTSGISGDWESWLRILLDEGTSFDFPLSDSVERSAGVEKTKEGQKSAWAGLSEDRDFMPGIGEIGLDFALHDKNIAEQENFFRKQLIIAQEMRSPVVLHTVRAVDRVLEILADYKDIPLFLFHGFVGTKEQIERVSDLGGFFSFSRRNIQPKNVKSLETIVSVPRDRILLESDGPVLAPRNTRPVKSAPALALQERDSQGDLLDEPAQISLTLRKIAEIRKTDSDELTQQIMINEKRFFRNWPRNSESDS